MKSVSVEISDSTYESLFGCGIADEAAMSLLLSAAITNYLHEVAGWFNPPSYPLRETGKSLCSPVSSIPLQYNDLGVGITTAYEAVVIIENQLFRLGPNGRA